MSRKIAVDIGDADDRFCGNCNWMNAEDDFEDHCVQYQGRIETEDWRPMRCDECISAELKPSISPAKVRELIKEANVFACWCSGKIEISVYQKIRDEILAELK